jgi:hypothetical protein
MLDGGVNIKAVGDLVSRAALCMFFVCYTATVAIPRPVLLLNDRDQRYILGF